ncbi:MAG: sigma-54 dependent transcriptional regulator [Desulfosalsimonas sp.]|uniref:sigma-54-dependent transcriptional regulator n=1 Tax=Desulfosalsimonas sp. TaxID=3073848 RepID=UPI003970DAFA
MFPTILIVDDEPSILRSLSGILMDEGFETMTATNGYEALQCVEAQTPDLVLLDIWMPGLDGIDTLKEIKNQHSHVQVVMITGHGTIETAVNATKMGAYDFIEKPLNIDRVIVAINNALNFRRLEEENRFLRKKTIEKYAITGSSPATMELKKQIQIAAPTDAWILITGENGTGKELVARTIHQLSARCDKPLVDVNCAALNDESLESELLGHEKGAFAGAATKKYGKFELAHTGTLFFDEIGDMGLKTQATILRILEEKQFQRLGGSRTIPIDVRVIAATNKNLKQAIGDGTFREDLYYRINVVPISVPALRERIEDIPALIHVFLSKTAEDNRTPAKQMAPEAVEMLKQYDWPGNVRELKNLVERLDIMAGDTIGVKDLPAPYNTAAGPPPPPATPTAELFSFDRLRDAQQAFEEVFIIQKLKSHDFDISKTAKATGADKTRIKKIQQKITRQKEPEK